LWTKKTTTEGKAGLESMCSLPGSRVRKDYGIGMPTM
jgi:hypothetical protein